MSDKLIHTLQLFGLLAVATVLIIFAHSYISPELVFTGMISGLAGIIGSRIASNGYNSQNEKPQKDVTMMNTQYDLPAIPKGK